MYFSLQEEILGAEVVNKGDPQKFLSCFTLNLVSVVNSNQTTNLFLTIFQIERMNTELTCVKKGLNKPPTPPEKIGDGDHNFYKEKKGAAKKKNFHKFSKKFSSICQYLFGILFLLYKKKETL